MSPSPATRPLPRRPARSPCSSTRTTSVLAMSWSPVHRRPAARRAHVAAAGRAANSSTILPVLDVVEKFFAGDVTAIDEVPVSQRSGPFLDRGLADPADRPRRPPRQLRRLRRPLRPAGRDPGRRQRLRPQRSRPVRSRATGCSAPTAAWAVSAGDPRSSAGCSTTRRKHAPVPRLRSPRRRRAFSCRTLRARSRTWTPLPSSSVSSSAHCWPPPPLSAWSRCSPGGAPRAPASSRCTNRSTTCTGCSPASNATAPPRTASCASRWARSARRRRSSSTRRPRWSRRCAPRTCAGAGARCSCGGWSRSPDCWSTATSSSSPRRSTTQGAGVRPDLVVTLADGRQVIVDAKVPFTGYIEAVQATDQAVRDQRVQMHARQLRAHVDALAARRYPTAFRPAAPFTVLLSRRTASSPPRWRQNRGSWSTVSRATSSWPRPAPCSRCCAPSPTRGDRNAWPGTRTRCSRWVVCCTRD